jgi:putative ABC transport system permease protein
MFFLRLAAKSLWNRRVTSALTVLSVALSIALVLSVDRAKRASEEGFTSTISGTDLIVGARSGPLNLLLYTVFNMGNATNNISMETYQFFKGHPAVEWTIPYSLGDSHRGFRVVGTDDNFYEHYRFRKDRTIELAEGQRAQGIWDVVLGADVAKKLNYQLGQKVVIAHGVTKGEGILFHDDKPFRVSGILKKTGTALDRSLYITLAGLEAVHIDWQSGAQPTRESAIPQDQVRAEDLKTTQITSFFLRTKSRIETLRLQREINTYENEALLAIIPGVTLGELWRGLEFVEAVLFSIGWLVIFVGLISLLIALLTSLNERRREMAILRSLGASPLKLASLLVAESFLLSVLGVIAGVVLHVLSFWLLKGFLENQLGLYLTGAWIGPQGWMAMTLTVILGALIGLLPAMQAQKRALKDGLSVKV